MRVLVFVTNDRLRKAICEGLNSDSTLVIAADTGDPVTAASEWSSGVDLVIRDHRPRR